MGYLLKWLTDDGPASSAMAVYQWKVKNPIVVQSMKLDVSADLQYTL